MNTESKAELPLPIELKSSGLLICYHDQLLEVIHSLLPDGTAREAERIDSYLTDFLNDLVNGRGHLPRDVVPTPGKGEMTHVLNGRLLRNQGIWLGLCINDDPLNLPGLLSLNRGTPDQLNSLIGGIKAIRRRAERRYTKDLGQNPVPKFRLH